MMYDSIFIIDHNKLIADLLPLKRRTAKMVQWLICLCHPVVLLYQEFVQYRDATNYKLEHTSQVFSIEDVLNDVFDAAQRRIYIEDGEYKLPAWFYDRADDKPLFFFDRANDEKVRFYDRSSLSLLNVDFTVVLPNGLNLADAELIRLRALVDFYRLPDKTYTITNG